MRRRVLLTTLPAVGVFVLVLYLAQNALVERNLANVGLVDDANSFALRYHADQLRDSIVSSLLIASAVFAFVVLILADRLAQSSASRRETERMYRTFVENTQEGVLLIDPRTSRIVWGNAAARRLLGYDGAALVGLDMGGIFARDSLTREHVVARVAAHHHVSLGDQSCVRGDGGRIDLEIGLDLVEHDGAKVLCAVLHDVSERKRTEEAFRHFAYHDPLTNLPNRMLFGDRLSLALTQSRRDGEPVSVLFLDLDRFKGVNDSLGHGAGDELLKAVALRLRRTVRSDDTLARQGGDEFMIVAPSTDGAGASALAERINREFRAPFFVQGREIYMSLTTGIATYPKDGADLDALVRAADTAMYCCKRDGRNNYLAFRPELGRGDAGALALKGKILRALEREQLVLEYQPIVDLAREEIVAVEALLRLVNDDGSLVYPGEFMEAAEESGAILPLGAWVLGEACRQAKQWADAGHDLRVAVNLSALQFYDHGLLDTIRGALERSELAPERLELEVTESVAMRDNEATQALLLRVREMGISLAMDDFGTGYSSLSYLRSFPFDRVKIDRSFLADVGHRSAGGERTIVDISIDLAHSLGLEVVAEGIETLEQYEYVRARGCDLGQGYGLSRPRPASHLTLLLEDPDALLASLEAGPRRSVSGDAARYSGSFELI